MKINKPTRAFTRDTKRESIDRTRLNSVLAVRCEDQEYVRTMDRRITGRFAVRVGKNSKRLVATSIYLKETTLHRHLLQCTMLVSVETRRTKLPEQEQQSSRKSSNQLKKIFVRSLQDTSCRSSRTRIYDLLER